jgi:hypothetical protein
MIQQQGCWMWEKREENWIDKGLLLSIQNEVWHHHQFWPPSSLGIPEPGSWDISKNWSEMRLCPQVSYFPVNLLQAKVGRGWSSCPAVRGSFICKERHTFLTRSQLRHYWFFGRRPALSLMSWRVSGGRPFLSLPSWLRLWRCWASRGWPALSLMLPALFAHRCPTMLLRRPLLAHWCPYGPDVIDRSWYSWENSRTRPMGSGSATTDGMYTHAVPIYLYIIDGRTWCKRIL